ncbi:hypothetical protein CEXT_18821 [Caerostris extrusa]|uniref:Uncharacterized protein n=1 Tax=Caerostris extrusa TaxID=172846 RepID=A0AAV4WCV2_CAEEX|nr:hypothetical protein CEXT_18821 [Caerostris extrusa]
MILRKTGAPATAPGSNEWCDWRFLQVLIQGSRRSGVLVRSISLLRLQAKVSMPSLSLSPSLENNYTVHNSRISTVPGML